MANTITTAEADTDLAATDKPDTPPRAKRRKSPAAEIARAPGAGSDTAKADKPAKAEGDSNELKKPELIDLVVERSGIKKRDAKPAVEAMLAVLAQALAEGRDLNLQPLGKLKITNRKDKDDAVVLNARLRQQKGTENT